MNNDLELIKLMQLFSNALGYIAEAITKDDQNSSARYELVDKAQKHLKKLNSHAAELLLAQQPNKEPEPQLQQASVSGSLPLEPCPKEMYLLEYFGIKEFDENQRLVVDLGILTDLLYGFEQKMGRQ